MVRVEWGKQKLKVTEEKDMSVASINVALFCANCERQIKSLDSMVSENHLQDIILLPWKVFDLGQSFRVENHRRKSGELWAK
jgi:hypothetical protein